MRGAGERPGAEGGYGGAVARDLLETGDERSRLLGRHDVLPAEHARVPDAAADVVLRDPFVELERRRERADLRVELPATKPACPKVLQHRLLFRPALSPPPAAEREPRAGLRDCVALPASKFLLGMASVASLSGPQSACVRA